VGVIAVGWATVELERAAASFVDRLASGATFVEAPECLHLGARCWTAALEDPVDGAGVVVLLEPSTEGRLAATLARHDEGWCATWEDDPAPLVTSARSTPRAGPFGQERLVLGGRFDGPHRLLVAPATIRA
jgi:hypothetical protein